MGLIVKRIFTKVARHYRELSHFLRDDWEARTADSATLLHNNCAGENLTVCYLWI